MPEIAWIMAPTTSPSSATWPSISFARSRQRAPCASRSSGPDGRTHISPKSSPKSEMRLPCNEGLLFPSRLRNGATTIFRPLTASTAIRTLNNPRYAGAYAYGRRHYRRAADGKKILRKRECNDWLACIPNAHPGYITWEQFQQNLKILETNGRGYQVA